MGGVRRRSAAAQVRIDCDGRRPAARVPPSRGQFPCRRRRRRTDRTRRRDRRVSRDRVDGAMLGLGAWTALVLGLLGKWPTLVV